MRTILNSHTLKDLQVPVHGHTDVRDTKLLGFVLRVRASGRHAYYYNYKRDRWLRLGDASVLKPHEARAQAQQAAALVAQGRDPGLERRNRSAGTLRGFVEGQFTTWAKAHQKNGGETVQRLVSHFVGDFGSLPLSEVTHRRVEEWRSRRSAAGAAAATINRDTGALKSALERAVDWGIIEQNPLARLRPLRTDRNQVARVLTKDEEVLLRAALASRDAERRAARARANDWRSARGLPLYPEHGEFTDHLTPVVRIALLTGLRRGELFSLDWADVSLADSQLIVRGAKAKSGQSRVVPLCREAREILEALPMHDSGLVFTSPASEGERAPLTTLKTAWAALLKRARIRGLRFHDLRHTFASRLLASGVDAATVRDLLGHQTFVITSRYAHASRERLQEAVATFDAARLEAGA